MRIDPWPIRSPNASPKGCSNFRSIPLQPASPNRPTPLLDHDAQLPRVSSMAAQVINNFEKRAIPAPPAEEKALLGRGRPLELLLGDEGPSLQVQSSLASH